MQATFTEEQQVLAIVSSDLASGGLADARRMLHGEEPTPTRTEALMSGFSGLAIPEERGGAGGSLIDAAILMEQLGREVAPTPFVSHLLATQLAYSAGLDVSRSAAGAEFWTLAIDEAGRRYGEWVTAISAGGVLKGQKSMVRDGVSADRTVVIARDDLIALAVPSEVVRRESMDPSRPLADLTFDSHPEEMKAGAAAGMPRVLAILAAELVGVGRGALMLAAEYAITREQFGQPVGRFQGVAHQLADALTHVELAWNATLYACWAVECGEEDGRLLAHAAKAKASEAALLASERCVQVHGGIGITMEADPHLYLRRAMSDNQWLGTYRHHRRLVGDQVLNRVGQD